MLICEHCCKTECGHSNNCLAKIAHLDNVVRVENVKCDACGQLSECFSCNCYWKSRPVCYKPAQDFLKIFQPVAETLADRNAKYGNVYQKLRQDEGDSPEGFIWEVRKKLARYREAMKRGEYATALDSIIDIAGYCALEMQLLEVHLPCE